MDSENPSHPHPEPKRESADHQPGASPGGDPGDGEWTYDLAPDEATDESAATEATPKPATPPSTSGPAEVGAVSTAAPFTKGMGKLRATLIAAVGVSLLALVMAGVRESDGSFQNLAALLGRVLLSIAAGGLTGTLAVIAAARCVGTRVAEPELFASRMLAASAAFVLAYAAGTPIPSRIDDSILAAAAYAVTVWFVFRLDLRHTGLVALWHLGIMGVLWLWAAMLGAQIAI